MSVPIFWFVWLMLSIFFCGAYFGMSFQVMWFLKNDMFKPERFPKKPWWWRK